VEKGEDLWCRVEKRSGARGAGRRRGWSVTTNKRLGERVGFRRRG
jgi:hypothetical protein